MGATQIRLSLCMIARDEAECLPRALQSVQGVVDEIVLVDTGSSDATIDVARRFGARIARVDWEDDFAAARNRSLALAGGEWILVLDADEELAPQARAQLPPLLAAVAPGVEGYLVQIISLTGPQSGPAPDQTAALRLFRNRPGYRFEGALHEQVAPSITRGNPGAKLAASPIQILHHGYRQAVAERKGKHERNLRILRKMLGQSPHSGLVHCHLGVEVATANLWAEAAAQFRTALDLAEGEAEAEAIWRPLAVKHYATALGQLERWAELQALLAAELPRYPRYTDLYYLNGLALHRLGHLAGAVSALRQAIALGAAPSPPYTSVTPALGGCMAHLAIGLVYEDQGCFPEAARAYMRALQESPGWRAPLLRFVSLLERAGGGDSLAEAVERVAASEAAGAPASAAAASVAGSAAMLALRFTCLLQAGDGDAARALARRGLAGRGPEGRGLAGRSHMPEFYTALASLLRDAAPDQLARALQAVPDPEALRLALQEESV